MKHQEKNIERLLEFISESKTICLLSHHNPDGDALGSSLGFYHTLKNMGKEAHVLIPNASPDFLKWLPDADKIVYYESQKQQYIQLLETVDLVICLDFNQINRLGVAQKSWKHVNTKSVLIDHHPEPELFANITISDTSVSSTAELVFEVIQQLKITQSLNDKAAVCLFTGIMTDTVNFSVNCSRPRTFEIVSELMNYKFDKEEVHRQVFNTFSPDRMRLLGYMLYEKMVLLPEYKSAYISLTMEEAKRYNFQAGDSEGFVNFPLNIKGIVFSAFIMERRDHIKLSFRSRGDFAVNELMETHFKGGGHKNAAGGEVSGLSVDEVIKILEQVIPLYPQLCE